MWDMGVGNGYIEMLRQSGNAIKHSFGGGIGSLIYIFAPAAIAVPGKV